MKVHLDFACDGGLTGNLRYIHRTLEDGTELYFVANRREASVAGTCSFRVEGKRPEFWWPQSGKVQLAAAWQAKDGVTRVPVYLEPAESVFVVFRAEHGNIDPVVALTHDGQSFPPAPPAPSPPAKIVVLKAIYGVPGDQKRTRDVTTAVQKLVDGGVTSFVVSSLAADGDPAVNVAKTLTVKYTADGKPHEASGGDPETIDLRSIAIASVSRPVTLTAAADGSARLEAWQNGRFELTTASGRKLAGVVQDLPSAQTVAGPWQVKFPAGSAAPAQLTLDSLVAWNLRPEDAVKYFSGTATYAKVITIPAELLGKDRGLYLDLGRVAVMARVKLNGHDLGVHWKAPYRVEIGQFAKAGDNTLEIEVTNLWINRMIGDENLPEDSARNHDGLMFGSIPIRRHAPRVAEVAVGRQTESHRPTDVHLLAALEERRTIARIRAARARDLAGDATRGAPITTRHVGQAFQPDAESNFVHVRLESLTYMVASARVAEAIEQVQVLLIMEPGDFVVHANAHEAS